MLHIPIYRHLLSLKYNEIRTKLIIAYVHMRLILHIRVYVIKSYGRKVSNYCPFRELKGGRLIECGRIFEGGA